jgi:uncharacterized membrane protein
MMASGHPAHPATVHFPVTFNILTGALDGLYALMINPTTSVLVSSVMAKLDTPIAPSSIQYASYYSTVLTMITAVPATITGAMELMPLIKRDGFTSPKAKTALAHAFLNDLVFFGAMYNWWTRRDVPGFEPSTANLAISSAFTLPTGIYAAYLGGSLVYDYGMGIGRKSKAKKEVLKEKQPQ